MMISEQEIIEKTEEPQCTCCDPVHAEDDPNCPVHGGK